LERFEDLKVKYETEKTEEENVLLREKNEIQDKLSVTLYTVILTLLVILVLLFYFFRTKTRLLHQTKKLNLVKEKRLKESIFAEKEISRLQNEKLKQKNRELSSATLHMLSKNNILSEISSKLEEITGKDNKMVSGKICKIISESTDSDSDWEQFNRHFNEVHMSFFDSLKSKYETLTTNDLKLCAYIRINLSSKEIAQMLHITTDTVNKNRYRLRKKLNLKQEDNLSDFIRNI